MQQLETSPSRLTEKSSNLDNRTGHDHNRTDLARGRLPALPAWDSQEQLDFLLQSEGISRSTPPFKPNPTLLNNPDLKRFANRRIILVSDAMPGITDRHGPYPSGVLTLLENTKACLAGFGANVHFFGPDPQHMHTILGYRTLELGEFDPARFGKVVKQENPDHIHIMTEGPIGLSALAYCRFAKLKFTTSFHTMVPDYLSGYVQRIVADYLPAGKFRDLVGNVAGAAIWQRPAWRYFQFFHSCAERVLATPAQIENLAQQGFSRLKIWERGMHPTLFVPRARTFPAEDGAVLLFVGRLADGEKSVRDYLEIKLPFRHTKYVVGDGIDRIKLESDYPEARFLGLLRGEALARVYANAHVLVMPSKTETWGQVMTEALACGVPIAAPDAPAQRWIVNRPEVGALDDDLSRAVIRALEHGDRTACCTRARHFTLERASEQLFDGLVSLV